jgi:hypothetical protein
MTGLHIRDVIPAELNGHLLDIVLIDHSSAGEKHYLAFRGKVVSQGLLLSKRLVLEVGDSRSMGALAQLLHELTPLISKL